MELKRYNLVEFGKHGHKKRLERFIRPGWDHSDLFFIVADQGIKMPHVVKRTVVDEAFESGQARIVEDDYLMTSLRPPEELGDQELARLELAWHVIAPLDEDPNIMDSTSRGQLIRYAIAKDHAPTFSEGSFLKIERFLRKLIKPEIAETSHETATFLWNAFDQEAKEVLSASKYGQLQQRIALAGELNRISEGPSIFTSERFSNVHLCNEVHLMLKETGMSSDCRTLNRLLLESAFPLEIAKYGKVLSRGTVVRLLSVFWQRGGEKSCLQLGYSNSTKERSRKGRKRAKDIQSLGEDFVKWGIPSDPKGVNVTEDDQKHFQKIITDFFHGKKRDVSQINKIPFSLLHERMWDEYYSDEVELPNGVKKYVRRPKHKVPTIDQLRYYYISKWSKADQVEARNDPVTVAKKYRGIPGDQTLRFDGPGFEYQIDATIADVHLVDDSREYWIGRPTLYSVVDTFSGMIVGLHATFENAQFSQAGEAILNSYRDKVSYCAEFGEEITATLWPVCGLPHSILADRGELLGKMFDNVVIDLGVRIRNTPPFRADLKGLVERSFKSLNDLQFDWLFGALPDKEYEPSKRKYRDKACFTLKEFTAAAIRTALTLNRGPRKTHPVREALRAAGVPKVPILMWQWGMKNSTSGLRAAQPNFVKSAFLPSAEADFSGRGIKFNHLYYWPKSAISAKDFLSAGRAIGERGQIKFHRHSVAQIYRMGAHYGDLEICELTDPYKQFSHLTWREWDLYKNEWDQSIQSADNYLERGETYQASKKAQAEAVSKRPKKLDNSRHQETRGHANDEAGKKDADGFAAALRAETGSPEKDKTEAASSSEEENGMLSAAGKFFS